MESLFRFCQNGLLESPLLRRLSAFTRATSLGSLSVYSFRTSEHDARPFPPARDRFAVN